MKSWVQAVSVFFDRRILTILVLGFSSGLPLLLVFSTLSYWMRIEGVAIATIGYFSLVRTPYSFKFLWAPLVDRLPIPLLSRLLGRRRAWALTSQIGLMAAIFGLAQSNPAETPALTAMLAVVVAFFSATQDILLDAYRIELLKDDEQGAGAGVYVNGYRIGMLVAGAGAIGLSEFLSWQQVYMVMAALVVIGIVTVLASREPSTVDQQSLKNQRDTQVAALINEGMSPWLARLQVEVKASVIDPFSDFMNRPKWQLALLLITLYKLGEAMLGALANPFYQDMGFTPLEIASVSKIFGLGATIGGALIGAVVVSRYGTLRALFYTGIVQALATLLFALQAEVGHNVVMLMVTIAGENVTAGMATTAFVAYLSSLCNSTYTASQYALLSSFMALARDVFASPSGVIAEALGWTWFFVFCSAIAVPALLLALYLISREPVQQQTALTSD